MASRESATISSEKYFSKYDDIIEGCLERWHVPGLSIGVVNGESTYAKGYGFARYPEEKVTPATLFNAASMTKAFVSSAISSMIDDEAHPKVQWDAPVSSLLRDDFVLSDSRYTEVVTLEDILSHRSGLPDMDDACMGIGAKNPDTPKSVTRKLRHLPMSCPPRTEYQYCNVMYVVAVHLVETLTGSWIGDFLRERIWKPLEMKDTYFGLDDVKEHKAIDGHAYGYRWDEDESSYVEVEWPVQPEGAGAGEMISTVGDYAKFLRCMINKSGPISKQGHEELVRPRMIVGDEPKSFYSQMLYALGWEVQNYHGEPVIGHDGSTSGFGSSMLYLPRLQWGIVIFGNADGAYIANLKICWTMIDDLLNVPMCKRFDWDEFGRDDEEEPECKTKEELYPKVPDTPIPLILPLEAYAGSYWNKGFETLVVQCKDGKLFVDATDRSWHFILSLDHVSGEFFTAEMLNIDTHDRLLLKAEFRVGADGVASELGIDFVEELDGKLIWFGRTETDEA